ncbi:MAG: aminodeoxychorismate synthase component I [Verrucomicrobiota bacterium]
MSFAPLIETLVAPELNGSWLERLAREPGCVLLRSAGFDSPQARYSLLAVRPFLTLTARGSRCELRGPDGHQTLFGDPWRILSDWLRRYEMPPEADQPFPLGGCFGYWGYDLKQFTEPKLTRRTPNDLELPDAWVGFYDHLLVVDHRANTARIVSTGLEPDGSRSLARARAGFAFWQRALKGEALEPCWLNPERPSAGTAWREHAHAVCHPEASDLFSTMTREAYLQAVRQAQHYIRHGHIYQVNLSQRLTLPRAIPGWEFFNALLAESPAPFAAYLNPGPFQIASSSPELFLRQRGNLIQTRPIKGTRPRAADLDQDARYTYELQTSAKEIAELVMITDLLRNDLGRVCEYGSVHVPDLMRLERYPHVQHLVSTVEGRLRPHLSHLDALAACFPGGSITGAPKFRAMEIIEELEPVSRGPYTGCLGYLGFNRESQLSIAIRKALCSADATHFHVGAGIVADSDPQAEYEETWVKARGFLAALKHTQL